MKRKRVTACLIALVLLLCLCLSACGGSESEKEETGSGEENIVSAEMEEETAGMETETVQENGSAGLTEAEFEEITVLDNEECAIKVTGLDPDNFWGYTVNVCLENKSEEKNYTFDVWDAAINGVECDPLFAYTVTAGLKSNNEVSFTTSTLEENGITEFTDIEITFRVYDSDDWFADDIARETVHIYPYGEENKSVYVRQPQETDTVLAENEFISATVIGYDPDGFWGYTLELYLENKTDEGVMFSIDNAAVNGYMIDPFWASSVAAGKSAFASVEWSESSLESNGITEVESIQFDLDVYSTEDWLADDYFNGTVTWNP